MKHIPVSCPKFTGNETNYVLDCIDSNWISSKGKYIDMLENHFADYIGSRFALTTNNGTTALHLSLLAYDIGPGDEVIVPTLTYIATANAVKYCGGEPVFVDSEPETGNIDPAGIRAKITPSTRGIIAVHLYGHPSDMDPILEIAREFNLFVIEDAAEAHGAEYKGRKTGSIGNMGIFSFYGNKIITTGEGGIITTNDPALADKMRLMKNQGMDNVKHFWHPVIGYNYRMTNIQAAIGLAQLENIEWHKQRRFEIAAQYNKILRDYNQFILPVEKPFNKHAYWMYTITINSSKITRDELMKKLSLNGIETRPVFYPVHSMPPYAANCSGSFPVAESFSANSINLPTFADLSPDNIAHICKTLMSIVSE